jgi:hypothetical protein
LVLTPFAFAMIVTSVNSFLPVPWLRGCLFAQRLPNLPASEHE